ncbi:hypothetical protein CDQ84_14525 [Clostridium thermosuccinogenes]|jgi:DeoR/GlpR family transcriptional regulator of sugar metabolism|uniref:HTH deoR-type domain-containing protein n=1 Tax=Clostridium thermosuccinogenes TaxID=84032 RepID=A0A2K2FDI4_9CLOT|nr:DeoR/GlpR family DNA-binding transcription regulator [Pseudoclostridium thermosuccinogenes]AUS96406.1 hypothetical protein CDO33_08175 [Pseudoclostridium thermosuccinogenes]PNT92928.1 hypothetical protein CDQ83_05060 [Pseudoclostridium thermosuccinogenes]PNT95621.1 hypothetical protein CDQ85_14390 [Pseudoclostridium thermosuccinogenes]PNT96817.1 hypothetical protein CDQ84_14525 [Pseudoclostridium thermosuccinogenes]
MLAVERRKRIAEIITENKSVLVTELSKMFDVTEETIRRDLEKLENQGVLVRSYGGATLVEDSMTEIPAEKRQVINQAGKDAIAKAASDLVNDGDTIFLDASTTTFYLARHIKDKKGVTVITNSEKVVMELSGSDGLNIICTGGILDRNNQSYVGRIAENVIKDNYYANKTFFSCRGVTLNRGLTDFNEQQAEIKRAMISCSDTAIFLCDHSKFGKIGVPVVATFDDIHCLITDAAVDKAFEDELNRKNVKYILANNR